MEAVILSIGNELLNGKTVNSNATYISRRLFEIGVIPRKIITVGDQREDMLRSLDEAMQQADVVITTGGLGPTHDDITKKVVAEYFKANLIFNQAVFDKIRKKFEDRGLKMPEVNREQALVPDNAQLIDNPVGSAPGMLFTQNAKRVFVLPGVPREMQAMVDKFVVEYLKKNFRSEHITLKLYRTTGIAESRIYELCRDLFDHYPTYEIAFLPKFIGVDLRIILRGTDAQDLQSYRKFEEALLERIGKYVYTTDESELEEVVGNLLAERGLTLSVAESCTGGLLQDRITNVAGSSRYFLGGMVAYSNKCKVEFLGVKESSLRKYGAVSEPVAGEMATGIRERMGADLALSTTGIAGPTGATPEKPIGLTYIGLAAADRTLVKKFQFTRERRLNKELGAQAALELLRRFLLGTI